MVQFYPWFKFSFLLFFSTVMYDNVCETREIKISTKDKIEQQHVQITDIDLSSTVTQLFLKIAVLCR